MKSCGYNVQIDDHCILINPERIEIGNNVRIDAFTKLVAGEGITIGDYVHVASYSSIMGGGRCIIEDFVTLSYGVRIITGGDYFLGNWMTNPLIPEFYRRPIHGKTILHKHCILGTNTIIHGGVELGEGTATGSGTIVTKSLPPWKVWIGAPAQFYKNRKSKRILEMENEIRKKEEMMTT